MSRASEFLTVFSKLEDEILRRARKVPQLRGFAPHEQSKKVQYFASSLDVLQDYGKDRVVNEHIDTLRLYGKLRNALSHNYDDDPIADPHEDTVRGIRQLYESITKPQLVSQIMTEKPVVFNVGDDAYGALGSWIRIGIHPCRCIATRILSEYCPSDQCSGGPWHRLMMM